MSQHPSAVSAGERTIDGRRPVALVTGGTRPGRVGAAVALELARAGCDVVLTERPGGTAAGPEHRATVRYGLLAVVPEAAVGVEALDLEQDDPSAWGAGLAARIPRLDVLVHNASLYEPTPLAELGGPGGRATFDRFMRTNAVAPVLLSVALAPLLRASTLRGGGAIVAMGDIHALGETGRARTGFTAYAMSKAALTEGIMTLARELAPNVRVNMVAPGWVAPPAHPAGAGPGARERYLGRTTLGREGTPEEAAAAVRFLALEATYTVGQVLRVDGGWSRT
jgi:pteridine reductase